MKLNRVLLSTLAITLAIGSGAISSVEARQPSSAMVFDFSLNEQAGTSMLVRGRNGVSASFGTSGTGIFPGFAYTLWYVVFNEPENCETPDGQGGTMCSETDVNPFGPANVDVLYGGGNVTGNGGTLHIAGHRKRGDNSGSVFDALGFPSVGLIYPETAEIHLVVRSHGPKVPENMPEQIQNFFGGCVEFLDPPEIADEEGECSDIQFSIQLP